jgi:hypothetical protein
MQAFPRSHQNRTDWACASLASRPYGKPNRVRLHYTSMARGYPIGPILFGTGKKNSMHTVCTQLLCIHAPIDCHVSSSAAHPSFRLAPTRLQHAYSAWLPRCSPVHAAAIRWMYACHSVHTGCMKFFSWHLAWERLIFFILRNRACILYIGLKVYILTKTPLENRKITTQPLQEHPGRCRRRRTEHLVA